ncbi:MAG: Leucine-rich repeat (LRR) protein [Halieaceae bacterium]|jgi:Leucine-rich repeat (LRR) protein
MRLRSNWPIILILLLLTGCGAYDFTVNERVVFTPKPLFTDYEIADTALNDCIKQAIVDKKITSAAQLSVLNCSHAGISSLAGIETFTGLSQLKLSSNQFADLSHLAPLSSLEDVYLDNNEIINPTPLFDLMLLRQVDLGGNSSLRCPTSSALLRVEQVRLPRHCG